MLIKDEEQDAYRQREGVRNNWKHAFIHDNDVILIKSSIDASNKQIFANNNFQSAGEAIMRLIEDTSGTLMNQIFMPSNFGERG